MKKCTRCINDTTVRMIDFDENGVCNYCRAFDKIKDRINDREQMSKLFLERIEKVRGRYDYDVALGISGGKDSMYVLYRLIHDYGLKVRTFTMDNGFFSDTARRNVDRMVKEFGVEHEYVEFDRSVLKRFFSYSVSKWLTPCVACSYIGYATMINYTSKINAGICIHGRSLQQMLRYYGNDVFTALVDAGLESPDAVNVDELYHGILASIESKTDKGLMTDVKNMLFRDISHSGLREFVSYFLYHPYNEDEIVDFLRKNTSWEPSEEYDHYDCNVHNAAHYIYQCAEGRPHCLPEISVLVRNNEISAEKALRMVQRKHYSSKPKDELKLLCDFVGTKPFWVLSKARIYNSFLKR